MLAIVSFYLFLCAGIFAYNEIYLQRNLDRHPLFNKKMFTRTFFAVPTYILFFTILFIGFKRILIFIPESWGTFNEEGDFDSVRTTISGLLSFLAMQIVIMKLIIERNDFKDALRVLASCNKNVLSQMKNSFPDNYDENRNIALSIILEKEGILSKYAKQKASPYPIDNLMLQMQGDKQKLIDLKETIYNDKWKYFYLYEWLKKFDKTIKEEIPEKLQKKYPKQIYYFRLNFLDKALPFGLKGEKMEWDKNKTPKGEEIIYELSNLITKKFYNDKDYNKLFFNFNMKKLEEYMKKNK